MDASRAHALRGEATFLDVREPYEYASGHVEGSLHVPIGQIAARWEEVPRGGQVVVVCQVGQRSGLVAEFLRARGLDAHNLEGGLETWVAQGYELTSEGHPGEAGDLSGERLNPP